MIGNKCNRRSTAKYRLNHTGRSAFYAAWYDNAEVWLLKPIRDNIAMLLRNLRKYSDLVDSNNNYIS